MKELLIAYIKTHPGEIKLFFAVFVGAVMVARLPKQVGAVNAVRGLFSGVVAGFTIPCLSFYVMNASVEKWYLVGVFSGYLGNYAWQLLDNLVRPVANEPWQFIVKYISQHLKQYLTKLINNNNNGNASS